MIQNSSLTNKIIVGRCEWCSMPELKIPQIKAKIDTGARTSALHAFDIQTELVGNKKYVFFKIYLLQCKKDLIHSCRALVFDERMIMSSNGQKEHRYIIKTTLKIANNTYFIELSLSNRDPLRFRLLLGREALNKRMIVDPSLMYQQGKKKKL